jgi:L-ascorbate metabolism protein UlaG (beta-lactamase superfamily)
MSTQLRWFPPSWLQLKNRGRIIYVDPAYLRTHFTKYPKRIEFARWPDPIDGLPEELEQADIVLVSHSHKDHCKGLTVNRLRRDDTLIVAPKRCTKELGKDVRVIRPGEEMTFTEITIKAVDAYNTEAGSSTRKIHHKGDGVGYLVMVDGKTIYHAGDTDFIPEMRELGAVDLALLPIGGTYTMDIQEAVEAAILIKPRAVIPMHRSKADPHEFKTELEAKSDCKVILLSIGDVYLVG